MLVYYLSLLLEATVSNVSLKAKLTRWKTYSKYFGRNVANPRNPNRAAVVPIKLNM